MDLGLKETFLSLGFLFNFLIISSSISFFVFQFCVQKIIGKKPSPKEAKSVYLHASLFFVIYTFIFIYLKTDLLTLFNAMGQGAVGVLILYISGSILAAAIAYSYFIKTSDGKSIGFRKGFKITLLDLLTNMIGSFALTMASYLTLYAVFLVLFYVIFGVSITEDVEIDESRKSMLMLFCIFINSAILLIFTTVPLTKKIIKLVTRYEASSKEALFLWFYARSIRLSDGRVMGLWRVALISIIQTVALLLAIALYAIAYLGVASFVVNKS